MITDADHSLFMGEVTQTERATKANKQEGRLLVPGLASSLPTEKTKMGGHRLIITVIGNFCDGMVLMPLCSFERLLMCLRLPDSKVTTRIFLQFLLSRKMWQMDLVF